MYKCNRYFVPRVASCGNPAVGQRRPPPADGEWVDKTSNSWTDRVLEPDRKRMTNTSYLRVDEGQPLETTHSRRRSSSLLDRLSAPVANLRCTPAVVRDIIPVSSL